MIKLRRCDFTVNKPLVICGSGRASVRGAMTVLEDMIVQTMSMGVVVGVLTANSLIRRLESTFARLWNNTVSLFPLFIDIEFVQWCAHSSLSP
jgi:hypothetical protein